MKINSTYRKVTLLLLLISLIGLILYLIYQPGKVYKVYHDAKNTQDKVLFRSEIDSIFSTFPKKTFIELDQDYLIKTGSSQKKYKAMLKRKDYYIIERKDLYKFIAGDVTIKDLIPQNDSYFRDCLFRNKKIYWPINKEVIYKLLELQHVLHEMGYNSKGFTLKNGHRYPRYNEKIGGAKLSRHIKGEAIDILIGDIDNNGKYEKNDKQIVLDILENKIIKNKGGIGRYPGTRSVHFDVRGYRARWDSY